MSVASFICKRQDKIFNNSSTDCPEQIKWTLLIDFREEIYKRTWLDDVWLEAFLINSGR